MMFNANSVYRTNSPVNGFVYISPENNNTHIVSSTTAPIDYGEPAIDGSTLITSKSSGCAFVSLVNGAYVNGQPFGQTEWVRYRYAVKELIFGLYSNA